MINMLGTIGPVFTTHKVKCTNYAPSDYDDNGDWIENVIDEEFNASINLQPLDEKSVKFLTNMGGVVQPERTFRMYLNNGKQVYHEREADMGAIEASTVEAEINGRKRKLRVQYADNRPHHNYCKAFLVLMELGK